MIQRLAAGKHATRMFGFINIECYIFILGVTLINLETSDRAYISETDHALMH